MSFDFQSAPGQEGWKGWKRDQWSHNATGWIFVCADRSCFLLVSFCGVSALRPCNNNKPRAAESPLHHHCPRLGRRVRALVSSPEDGTHKSVAWHAVARIVLGAALYLWSTCAFAVVGRGTPGPWDAPRHLDAVGPYRRVRNPIYIAAIIIVAGGCSFRCNCVRRSDGDLLPLVCNRL
jgi:hypothetical protein